MSNITIEINPLDAEELGIIVLLLSESGVAFKVNYANGKARQVTVVPDKRIIRHHPAKPLTAVKGNEIVRHIRDNPTVKLTCIGDFYGYSATVIRRLRDGKHTLQLRGEVSLVGDSHVPF